MGRASRDKGSRGELELAALLSTLTGYTVTRRCRRHDLDDDLIGVPGWSIEVKRHATYTRGDLERWWQQCEEQAGSTSLPVLFVRRDRDEWRAIWRYHSEIGGYWATVEGSPQLWAGMLPDRAID